MPTVSRIGPYRFFLYSNEPDEPAHIHVQRDKALAKFWLEPIGLARSRHFAAQELTTIRKLIEDNLETLLEAWHGRERN